jgi:hypothetical protein
MKFGDYFVIYLPKEHFEAFQVGAVLEGICQTLYHVHLLLILGMHGLIHDLKGHRIGSLHRPQYILDEVLK